MDALYASYNKLLISIHALREEGDGLSASTCSMYSNFYPRPPRGGRRSSIGRASVSKTISIHALREEGDWHRPGCPCVS